MKLIHCITAVCLGMLLVPAVRAEDAGTSEAPRSDWARVGNSRYNWEWLVKHRDYNGDGQVDATEVPFSEEVFNRIDRTWDGVLTAADFDWSKEGPLCKQKETTFALFKPVDKDSNGRVTAEEWQMLFEEAAKDKGYIGEEELERLIYLPRVQKTAREDRLRASRSDFSPERMKLRTQTPLPGEVAPDFELRTPDGAKSIRLSSFQGRKPVVLIFGCFTCGNYRTYSQSMEKLFEHWKDEAEFLRVYVREAHPVAEDQPATSTNALAGIIVKQPTTYEERCSVATKFVSVLNVKTPVVVDELDNKVGQAYGGWPDRLYLVDRDGRIAFAGAPGPFGFNPRELEQALAMLVLDDASK